MKNNFVKPDSRYPKPYPRSFIYGLGAANPKLLSLVGIKIDLCLRAIKAVRGRILELGCGGGQYLRALKQFRPELELYSVDLDPAAVSQVKSIPGVSCDCADVAALPFSDNQFAAVIGFDILEHTGNPGRVLSEVARVLLSGGIFHLYVPCEGNPKTIYVKRGHGSKARHGGHIQQFRTEEVIKLIEQTGLELVSLRHADYWLTQLFDYVFFDRLDKSANPEELWAAQALKPGHGFKGWLLRLVRRGLSVLAWLESKLRQGAGGAMGAHITARKIK